MTQSVSPATILHVDDDPAIRAVVERALEKSGHRAINAQDVPSAMLAMSRHSVDLIISDEEMPGMGGLDFLEMLRQEGYELPVIMLTGHASIAHAVTSIRSGATDYLAKPFELEELTRALERALRIRRLELENQTLRQELSGLRSAKRIVGGSAALRKVMRAIDSAAPTRATVLLLGESGTGKELFATAVHELSGRGNGAFVKLNCAALPEGLIESALFGHERGAFTGALKRVHGAFERADRGTLLLDEISELRLDLQAKLLRVLQEQEFERVGGAAQIRVDVRVIATSNRDLEKEVARGSFRQDLYFRLNAIPIAIPPLRERQEDIPALAVHFARGAAADLGRPFGAFTPEATDLLQRYEWPGNIRELQHVVERALIFSDSPVLGTEAFRHLKVARPDAGSAGVLSGCAAPAHDRGIFVGSFNLEQAEALLIEAAMESVDNNRTKAAELLGISVRTLWTRLKARGEPTPR